MGEKVEAQYALRYAQSLGASYTDLRVVRRCAVRHELICGFPNPTAARTAGLGIRVLVNGAWGFTSLMLDGAPGPARLRELVKECVELAEVSARCRQSRTKLAPLRGFVPGLVDCRTRATTPYHSLSLKSRAQVLADWDHALSGKMICARELYLETEEREDYLAQLYNGEFREIYQNRAGCEIFLSTTAVGYGEVQTRSRMLAGIVGYPFPLTEEVTAIGRQLRREAVALLRAPECKEEQCDVVLAADMLSLQIHESVHGMKADRAGQLNYEATFMGGDVISDPRFLSDDGSFLFANKCVTLLADATRPGGYGTFSYDDDGSPASCFPLLAQGEFKNFHHSRETAGELFKATGDHMLLTSPAIGCARASDHSRMPLVRMTNTVLVPGQATFGQLISGIDRGLFIATPYAWSMFPDRRGFIFGCEIGRLIRKGKLAGLVRNPAYRGETVPFWRSISAVGCETEFHNQPDCGKGLPAQRIGTGHLTPPVLAEGVQVFSRRRFRNPSRQKGDKKPCC